MLTGAVIGIVVSLVMIMQMRSKAKTGTGLPGDIERAMRGKDPLNLSEIAKLVGKDTFLGRGSVLQAIAALENAGKVRTIHAPPDTAQLDKVKVTKYALIGDRPPGA